MLLYYIVLFLTCQNRDIHLYVIVCVFQTTVRPAPTHWPEKSPSQVFAQTHVFHQTVFMAELGVKQPLRFDVSYYISHLFKCLYLKIETYAK